MWMVDGGCVNVHTLPSVSFNLGTADAPKYFDIPPILWTKPVRPRPWALRPLAPRGAAERGLEHDALDATALSVAGIMHQHVAVHAGR